MKPWVDPAEVAAYLKEENERLDAENERLREALERLQGELEHVRNGREYLKGALNREKMLRGMPPLAEGERERDHDCAKHAAFDRSVCACGTAHDFCLKCGAQVDPCVEGERE